MTALPWLETTARAGSHGAPPRVGDLLAIVAVVALAALISALCEQPPVRSGALLRQGGRS